MENKSSYAIRNQQYKLINNNGVDELYDLIADPYETNDLLNEEISSLISDAKVSLETALNDIRN